MLTGDLVALPFF